ncbi:MAG: Tetraacyldisaccharide 4'-kinase [Steroidobacteraceae bacterium]|nr:Tetraacyldisaccharide 4'-kinase [Steroidobacteraceae bacterium]
MERWLNAVWYGRAFGAALLRPLSWLFALAVALRRQAYRIGLLSSTRLSLPVIVVGNLTVGGTGKTPFTVWLVSQLAAAGHRPGVVSRGYGRGGDAPRLVEGASAAAEVGDEPLLIHRRTARPVAVGRRRAVAGRLLATQNVDVIVADDGLQHLALARDCELVLIDGERGHGNGLMLPAGPLREGPARLRKVDAVILTEGSGERSLAGRPVFHMRLAATGVLPLAGPRDTPLPLASLAGQRVHAVAGIGHPGRFFRTLRDAGLDVVPHAFPDHHVFTAADLAFDDDLPILMTEKDAVKCAAFASSRLGYVPVSASFGDEDARALLALVDAKIAAFAHRA